jgi:hypothetical protein
MKILDLQEKSSEDVESKKKKISEFLENPGKKTEQVALEIDNENNAVAEQRRKTYIQMIS